MSDTARSPLVGRDVERPLTSWWLVATAALPPSAWLVHIAAMPALVPLACETDQTWPMHLTTVVTALVAAGALLGSYRTRSRVASLRADQGSQDEQGPHDEVRERGATWSTWSVVLGWLFLVLILAEHVPVLLLSPCPP